jgi:signal transduction histidine kinase/phage shock protein PspC (stress-responsive transcriptional regulator)
MTATDSSHLEPDIRHSESGPTPPANPVRDDIESLATTTESTSASAAPIAKEGVPDSDAGDSEDKPRATRVAEGAWLGGVCTGLARHLGWPLMVVRIAFVALATFQFIGVIAYGALWLLLPPESTVKAPGLESASRAGLREESKPKRRIDWGMLLALIALGVGLLWIMQNTGLGISSQLFWPVAFACAGAALVWRQADSEQQKRWRAEAGGRVWLAPFVARGGWPALVRVIVGLGLVGAAFGIVIAQQGQIAHLPEVMAMTMLALAGLAIVLAPWLHRSRSALNQARAEKVRADARADMAAHLHDSVLQTLAMIQRQADDPKAVQQLARRQERELRNWLYGDELPEATLKAALTSAAAEVEDERGVPVELVTVGDCDTSDSIQALVRAAREAMVNAAKHSGADKIDVYAEVDEESVEVFVRDRGNGFDAEAVAEDRMGVKGSIVDRMARHGGTATIRSAPGDGTEVRLEIKR